MEYVFSDQSRSSASACLAKCPRVAGHLEATFASCSGSSESPGRLDTSEIPAASGRGVRRVTRYLRDTARQWFTYLSSLRVKWWQVQIVSARPEFQQVRGGFGEIRSRF